jgi:hypothetical protein
MVFEFRQKFKGLATDAECRQIGSPADPAIE